MRTLLLAVSCSFLRREPKLVVGERNDAGAGTAGTHEVAGAASSWRQWYVRNIGKVPTPPDYTLYVDDVSIDTSLN